MKYRHFVWIAFLLFPVFIFCQEDGYDLKVMKMMEVSGVKDNFKEIILLTVENQKHLALEEDREYYEVFKEEIMKVGEDKLLSKYGPIYRKYLSESDLDVIIEFYQTEAGKTLANSMPSIYQDASEMGEEWAIEISESIDKKIGEIKSEKFNVILQDDCSIFREGTFSEVITDSLYMNDFSYVRTGNTQVENRGEEETSFRITWISNCRYSLEMLDEDGELTSDPRLVINIFKIEGNSYWYMAKMDGEEFYLEGQLLKE